MLVLTRRVGERIRIGPDTWVTLVEVSRGDRRARIGIEAPRNVPVMREELITDGERVKGHDLSNL